jgi:aminoglycoside 2''-phosphotransferase
VACVNNDEAWDWNSLDHSSAAKLLAGPFPGSALEPFGSGDFCLAFKRVDQVIRVARHPEAAGALERESCILPKIASRLPLPIPEPIYHAPHGCPPYTIHEEIVGEALTREAWEDMPASARERAASGLATFLKALHALPIEIGLECGLVQIDSVQMAGSLREEAADTIFPLLEPDLQGKLQRTLGHWASQQEVPCFALLHRDIGPGHVLYDPLTLQLTGVIDFGDLVIGDPARDFIYIYEDFGPTILQEVLTHYAVKDAPTMMAAIRKWYLLEAISWTIAMYRQHQEENLKHGLAEIRRELAAAMPD